MDYNDFMMMNAALTGLNNSLANAGNMYIASQTSKQDRKFSREMSELAYKRNIELWNMQNEYNTPANQYARQLEGLRANGLNPNLVYGSSSSIGGAAGAVSPYRFEGYHATAVPQFRGGSPIDAMLNTRLLQTQIAAQEANNRLVNARAQNEEDRNPGILAKSNEAAYRWNYITSDIMDDYDSAIRATVSAEYWKGSAAHWNADILRDKSKIQFYEAAMAEWLNTTKIEGMDMTYKQYMETCKSYLPGVQYEKFKAEILNIASMIAYRKEQGQLLNLKQEYQQYVNRLARFGRSLGNDWVTLLISGLSELWPKIFPDLPVTESPKSPRDRGAMESGDW